jgi:putative DNA primase/helicase
MMGEYALDYARRGWAVFPCMPADKAPYIPADLNAEGKKIPRSGGLYKATRDPAVISEWWHHWPRAMIGVRCGDASGIWAIDPDAPKKPGAPNGKANWAALKLKHGCPHTHTHLTPGGGEHLLFRWRADRPLTNSAGSITGTGIDVRGEGGYIIAPPSRRHDGKAYEVAEPLDFFNFAEAPDWLYEMLRPKPRPAPAGAFRPSSGSNAGSPVARIQGILNTVASAGEGDRNKVLFWGAMRVVDMVVTREVPPSEGDRAFAALASAAQHAGLPYHETVRTLQSARARA